MGRRCDSDRIIVRARPVAGNFSVRIVPIGLALLFLCAHPPYVPAEPSGSRDPAAQCQKAEDKARTDLLQKLRDLETTVLERLWKERKSWELAYNALWEARQKKEDDFSLDRQTEGEVETERYQSEWEALVREVGDLAADLRTGTETLRSGAKDLASVCPAWGYQNCHDLWKERVLAHLEEWDILIASLGRFLESRSAWIRDRLEEAPSDHTPYGPRTAEFDLLWHEKWEPEIYRLLRVLEEDFKIELPKKSCCRLCTEAGLDETAQSQINPLAASLQRDALPGIPLQKPAVTPTLKALQESVREKRGDGESE